MIGQTVSQYKILSKLGEGGMGEVYKAHDTRLDRDVALKFLPSRLQAGEQEKARFMQEARAASALNHPNVCTIYDIQEHDGLMFIAMEYVEGQTLRELVAAGNGQPLPVKRSIDIGIQIAEGLAAAHEKGIVHRDIKPENIMIRKDGIVQIMDFGLAKLRNAGSTVNRLTKEGSTVGTAGYMSPEQIQGQDIDYRSDIFSLGVLLYELFTGELPFKGVHETALAYEIVNMDPAPMTAVRPELDPAIDTIVLECLEKEPRERTQSASQVALNLKRYRRESGRQHVSRVTAARPVQSRGTDHTAAPPVPAGSSRRQYYGYYLAGILALACIALLIFSPGKAPSGSGPVMRFSINLPASAPLWGGVGVSGIAISPDGKCCAYIANVSNSNRVFLRRIDRLSSEELPGSENAAEPTFSPDGQWIAFNSANDRILRIPINGGAPEQVCPIQGQTRGIHWAADNTIYFGTLNGGIFKVPATGGRPAAVTTLDTSDREISHRYPQILPDGKTMIFTVKQNSITTFDDALIAVQDLRNNYRTTVIRGGTFGRYVTGGYLVYLRDRMIFAVHYNESRHEVSGTPVPLEEGAWIFKGTGQAYVDFSQNGTMIFAPSGPRMDNPMALTWMDFSGGSRNVFDSLRPYQAPRISPDGGKIAMTVNAANNDIWIYNTGREILTRFTFGGGNNDFPVWTPDGNYLYYAAERSRMPNIFRRRWDGSGQEERITNSPATQQPVDCSSDGKYLSINQEGDIWMLPLTGAPDDSLKPRPFINTTANESSGMFSPDGRWLAYCSDESGKKEIYVTPFPGHQGKWQISSGGGIGPIWSRDGKILCYRNGSVLMKVTVRAADTFDYTEPAKVCDVPSSSTVSDIAPDGKRFLVIQPQGEALKFPQINVVVNWFDEIRSAVETASH